MTREGLRRKRSENRWRAEENGEKEKKQKLKMVASKRKKQEIETVKNMLAELFNESDAPCAEV